MTIRFLRKDADSIASMMSNRAPKQALSFWIGFQELRAACSGRHPSSAGLASSSCFSQTKFIWVSFTPPTALSGAGDAPPQAPPWLGFRHPTRARSSQPQHQRGLVASRIKFERGLRGLSSHILKTCGASVCILAAAQSALRQVDNFELV